VIGAFFFFLMMTGKKGRKILAGQHYDVSPAQDDFRRRIEEEQPQRVRGQAIYLAANPDRIPQAVVQNLNHNKILHSEIMILHFKTEDIPRVPNFEKIEEKKLFGGIYRIVSHHGYMEAARIDTVLSLVREQGIDFDRENASFFLGREKLVIGKKPRMHRWRSNLFMFMSKNAMDAGSFFGIPSDQVIEVGVQLEL
jgi:KUP system potassium uptake protein